MLQTAGTANVTGFPAIPLPLTVAVRVFVAGVPPRLQFPTDAIPKLLVVAFAPVMVPPPLATTKVTLTPVIPLPFASFTMTDGRVVTDVPTRAASELPALIATLAAAPGSTVTANGDELMFPMEAVMLATPIFTPVTTPPITVATAGSLVDQLTVIPVNEPPRFPVTDAARVTIVPDAIDVAPADVTEIVAGVSGGVAGVCGPVVSPPPPHDKAERSAIMTAQSRADLVGFGMLNG